MKNNKQIDITMILDRSGSMKRIQDQVIESFNSFIKEQQEIDGKALVSLFQFNTRYEVNFTGVDLMSVNLLNTDTYVPRAGTALLDAIGKTIVDTKERTKNDDSDVVIVITTDGLENSSVVYRLSQVRKMINKCENELGWKFLYLAADDASFDQRENFGFNHARSVKTGRGERAHAHAAKMMSDKLGLYRLSGNEKDLHFTDKERLEADKLDDGGY